MSAWIFWRKPDGLSTNENLITSSAGLQPQSEDSDLHASRHISHQSIFFNDMMISQVDRSVDS